MPLDSKDQHWLPPRTKVRQLSHFCSGDIYYVFYTNLVVAMLQWLWHKGFSVVIERTYSQPAACGLPCDIANHCIKIFLQYVFALPMLGF